MNILVHRWMKLRLQKGWKEHIWFVALLLDQRSSCWCIPRTPLKYFLCGLVPWYANKPYPNFMHFSSSCGRSLVPTLDWMIWQWTLHRLHCKNSGCHRTALLMFLAVSLCEFYIITSTSIRKQRHKQVGGRSKFHAPSDCSLTLYSSPKIHNLDDWIVWV